MRLCRFRIHQRNEADTWPVWLLGRESINHCDAEVWVFEQVR
jgi:hypothetical protein